jgi:SNF2 family DNA or RNA helicase
MIRIDKRGKRIVIHSSEPLRGLKSAVPGAYQAVGGHWTVPLSIESCKLLKTKYGNQIEAGNELKRWIRGVVDARAYMEQLSKSNDAELEYLPKAAPRLVKAMRKRTYQRVGARFIADNSATLLADDPGLGKTLEAMGGILEAQIPGPYIVCAPKTAAVTVWKREIERWLPRHHRAIVLPELWYERDRKIRLTKYGPNTWFIVHPEVLLVPSYWVCHECRKRTPEGAKQQKKLHCGHIRGPKTKRVEEPKYPTLFTVEWGAAILDESHESLIVRKGARTQRRRGLDMIRDKVRPDGIRLAVSGTPFNSKPHQLWGTLNWLDPVNYPAFYRWAELFWTMGGYGGYEVQELREDREEMLWDSLSAIALRRTKGEVAKDLPPKMEMGEPLYPGDDDSPVGVWLPMEGQQERAYTEFEERAVTELESGRLEAIYAIEELTRLKQLACAYGDIELRWVNLKCQKIKNHEELYPECSGWTIHKVQKQFYSPRVPSNKLNWIKENLEEWGYPKNPIDKVVIVSFYSGILREFAQQIDSHFKSKNGQLLCTGITGRTPSNKRAEIIDNFNRRDRNSPQIMMLNVRAGGTAITIDSADRMIFVSETRIPAQQQQAEDRIHRISNPRNCMYYYLRSLGTVDIGTALINQGLKRGEHRLLDGRRGVDYFRQVVQLGQSHA